MKSPSFINLGTKYLFNVTVGKPGRRPLSPVIKLMSPETGPTDTMGPRCSAPANNAQPGSNQGNTLSAQVQGVLHTVAARVEGGKVGSLQGT